MRYPGFVSFDGMVFYSSPNTGPKVTPGKYNIRLTYNNEEHNQEFEIIKDPRVSNSDEDYKKQLDFLLKVRDEVSRANRVIIDIRKIKSDLDFLMEKVHDKDQIIDLIKKYIYDLEIIENRSFLIKSINDFFLYNLNQGTLMNSIERRFGDD